MGAFRLAQQDTAARSRAWRPISQPMRWTPGMTDSSRLAFFLVERLTKLRFGSAKHRAQLAARQTRDIGRESLQGGSRIPIGLDRLPERLDVGAHESRLPVAVEPSGVTMQCFVQRIQGGAVAGTTIHG